MAKTTLKCERDKFLGIMSKATGSSCLEPILSPIKATIVDDSGKQISSTRAFDANYGVFKSASYVLIPVNKSRTIDEGYNIIIPKIIDKKEIDVRKIKQALQKVCQSLEINFSYNPGIASFTVINIKLETLKNLKAYLNFFSDNLSEIIFGYYQSFFEVMEQEYVSKHIVMYKPAPVIAKELDRDDDVPPLQDISPISPVSTALIPSVKEKTDKISPSTPYLLRDKVPGTSYLQTSYPYDLDSYKLNPMVKEKPYSSIYLPAYDDSGWGYAVAEMGRCDESSTE